jgi:hypothetical protein
MTCFIVKTTAFIEELHRLRLKSDINVAKKALIGKVYRLRLKSDTNAAKPALIRKPQR